MSASQSSHVTVDVRTDVQVGLRSRSNRHDRSAGVDERPAVVATARFTEHAHPAGTLQERLQRRGRVVFTHRLDGPRGGELSLGAGSDRGQARHRTAAPARPSRTRRRPTERAPKISKRVAVAAVSAHALDDVFPADQQILGEMLGELAGFRVAKKHGVAEPRQDGASHS